MTYSPAGVRSFSLWMQGLSLAILLDHNQALADEPFPQGRRLVAHSETTSPWQNLSAAARWAN
jgi:hypothetical protein